MENIDLQSLKRIQLEILKNIASYCDEHGLIYFLAYGTLIGAIRHHGYIPWDDDIDIIMPRKDYDKLMQEYNSDDNYIKVICPNNNINYYLPFGKAYDIRTELWETQFKKNVYGVYIDIFPLDNIDGVEVLTKIEWLKRFVNTKKAVFHSDRTIWKKLTIAIGKILLSPFSIHYLLSKMEYLATQSNNKETKNVCALYSSTARKEVAPRDMFVEFIEMPFENGFFKIPKRYDEYLRLQYGDYMQLPPIEQQIPHHVFKAWWKQ